MNILIEKNKNIIIDYCKELKVKSIYIFGSANNENFNDKSDLDFLIAFQDDISIEDYTDNYFELHYKLRKLFNRNIDIITERTLSNPYFIESINESKEMIYEAKN